MFYPPSLLDPNHTTKPAPFYDTAIVRDRSLRALAARVARSRTSPRSSSRLPGACPRGRRSGCAVGDEGDGRQQSGRQRERCGVVDLEDQRSTDQRAEQHRCDGECATTDPRAGSAGERRVCRDTGQGHVSTVVVRSGTASVSRRGVLNAHRDGQENDHGVAASGSDVAGRERRDHKRAGDEQQFRRGCGGDVSSPVARPANTDPTARDAADEKRADRGERCPDRDAAGTGDSEARKTTLPVM